MVCFLVLLLRRRCSWKYECIREERQRNHWKTAKQTQKIHFLHHLRSVGPFQSVSNNFGSFTHNARVSLSKRTKTQTHSQIYRWVRIGVGRSVLSVSRLLLLSLRLWLLTLNLFVSLDSKGQSSFMFGLLLWDLSQLLKRYSLWFSFPIIFPNATNLISYFDPKLCFCETLFSFRF